MLLLFLLPPDCYDTFLNPTKIMTNSDMQPFAIPIPTGGVGLVLSYFDPSLGAGVQATPTDSNCIITQNG